MDDTELSFSGKSDPYCVVGIISERCWNDEKFKRGDLVKWQKGGMEVDVFRSAVKLATLEPQWNEYFELWVCMRLQCYVYVCGGGGGEREKEGEGERENCHVMHTNAFQLCFHHM